MRLFKQKELKAINRKQVDIELLRDETDAKLSLSVGKMMHHLIKNSREINVDRRNFTEVEELILNITEDCVSEKPYKRPNIDRINEELLLSKYFTGKEKDEIDKYVNQIEDFCHDYYERLA